VKSKLSSAAKATPPTKSKGSAAITPASGSGKKLGRPRKDSSASPAAATPAGRKTSTPQSKTKANTSASPGKSKGTARVFRLEFTLEDAIGSHACSLDANMRVTNGIPLGCPLFLTVHTVNCVETLKVIRLQGNRLHIPRRWQGRVAHRPARLTLAPSVVGLLLTSALSSLSLNEVWWSKGLLLLSRNDGSTYQHHVSWMVEDAFSLMY
jgi:hypothetical protein